MAILNSSLLTAGHRYAQALEQAMMETLIDKFTIQDVPGMTTYLGSINATKSDTGRIRFSNIGTGIPFVSVGEDDELSDVTPTYSNVDIEVGRSGQLLAITDLAVGTGGPGDWNPQLIATKQVDSYANYFTQQFMTAGSAPTNTTGTTATDLTAENFFDATYALRSRSVPGPFFFMASLEQVNNVINAARAEGGALAFDASTANLLGLQGQGFEGSWNNVAIFKSAFVIETTADALGFMFGAGAFGWKNMIPDATSLQFGGDASVAIRMDELVVEIGRKSRRTRVDVIGNAWSGQSIIEDDRIQGVHTDA